MLHLYKYMYLAMQVKNLKWIFIYTRDKIMKVSSLLMMWNYR